MRLLFLIIGNIVALFLASKYIEGVILVGGIWGLLVTAAIFSVVNFLLKPILKIVLSPFIILSFGLLIIAINMGILWLTDSFVKQIQIETLSALFLTTILIGIVNFVIHIFNRE